MKTITVLTVALLLSVSIVYGLWCRADYVAKHPATQCPTCQGTGLITH